MTIIKTANSLIDETYNAVKLARYAQLAGYAEDQFFGLNNPDTQQEACKPIWTLPERAMIARYLGEAQDEIEQVVGYPLYPKWFTDEQHPYTYPLFSKWMKIIASGFRQVTTIQAGVTVSYATDPSVVIVATIVTDENEIRIFHPGTEIEIIPSDVTIVGNVATIQIPRARLVKQSKANNPETGWDYDDIPPSASSPFTATVDVAHVFTDDSIQGGLIWSHKDSSGDCACTTCPTCGEYSQTACVYLRNPDLGIVDVLPAAYGTDSTWTSALCSVCYCDDPNIAKVNYLAGLQTLTPQAEDAIIRLAHAKMPSPPCGCGVLMDMWKRDRNTPQVLDAKRLDCPFGLSDGAWVAWRFANAMRGQRGMVMG